MRHVSLVTLFTTFTAIALLLASCGQKERKDMERHFEQKPQLVVGIMVDQFRPDYVDRFWDNLSENGFKRLVREGFSFTNFHFDYMPTATGPGHAGVYSGTTPAVHGAMGNSWYVRELDRSINVIELPGYEGVGSAPDYDGSKGPGNMLTTTVGDELRLHTNFESRVVGISRKDRGAILPAGHTGDAYWYEGPTGNFVTSTYYRDELPGWLQEFNSRNLAEEYLSEPWEPLLPIEAYEARSIGDDNPYERPFAEGVPPVFPHDLPALIRDHGYDAGLLGATPLHDRLLTDLAIAAIEGEGLGRGNATDMLAISFSALDAVGHRFGPAAIETQDAFLRLDREFARLLDYLDREFGKENILFFVTSDHGVVHVPDYLSDNRVPAGHFDTSAKLDSIREFLESAYGVDLLLAYSNWNLFLDHELMERNNLDHSQVQLELARFVRSLDGVAGSLTADALTYSEFTRGIPMRAQKGFNQKRSGDVVFWLDAQHTPGTAPQGTTHGSPWIYDTHAPMYWYGGGIKPGRSAAPSFISDIAPTVATFLGSPLPSGTTGKPLNDLIKGK